MSEYKACLDCPGACCKAPLANKSNMDNFGEVRKSYIESDIEAVVERIMSIILNSRLRMSGAELSLLGVLLDIEETSPGLIIVLWHIQFECLYLSNEGKCLNYEGRPSICRDYACSTVEPRNYRPSRDELLSMNQECESIDWSGTAKNAQALKAELRETVNQIFDK